MSIRTPQYRSDRSRISSSLLQDSAPFYPGDSSKLSRTLTSKQQHPKDTRAAPSQLSPQSHTIGNASHLPRLTKPRPSAPLATNNPKTAQSKDPMTLLAEVIQAGRVQGDLHIQSGNDAALKNLKLGCVAQIINLFMGPYFKKRGLRLDATSLSWLAQSDLTVSIDLKASSSGATGSIQFQPPLTIFDVDSGEDGLRISKLWCEPSSEHGSKNTTFRLEGSYPVPQSVDIQSHGIVWAPLPMPGMTPIPLLSVDVDWEERQGHTKVPFLKADLSLTKIIEVFTKPESSEDIRFEENLFQHDFNLKLSDVILGSDVDTHIGPLKLFWKENRPLTAIHGNLTPNGMVLNIHSQADDLDLGIGDKFAFQSKHGNLNATLKFTRQTPVSPSGTGFKNLHLKPNEKFDLFFTIHDFQSERFDFMDLHVKGGLRSPKGQAIHVQLQVDAQGMLEVTPDNAKGALEVHDATVVSPSTLSLNSYGVHAFHGGTIESYTVALDGKSLTHIGKNFNLDKYVVKNVAFNIEHNYTGKELYFDCNRALVNFSIRQSDAFSPSTGPHVITRGNIGDTHRFLLSVQGYDGVEGDVPEILLKDSPNFGRLHFEHGAFTAQRFGIHIESQFGKTNYKIDSEDAKLHHLDAYNLFKSTESRISANNATVSSFALTEKGTEAIEITDGQATIQSKVPFEFFGKTVDVNIHASGAIQSIKQEKNGDPIDIQGEFDLRAIAINFDEPFYIDLPKGAKAKIAIKGALLNGKLLQYYAPLKPKRSTTIKNLGIDGAATIIIYDQNGKVVSESEGILKFRSPHMRNTFDLQAKSNKLGRFIQAEGKGSLDIQLVGDVDLNALSRIGFWPEHSTAPKSATIQAYVDFSKPLLKADVKLVAKTPGKLPAVALLPADPIVDNPLSTSQTTKPEETQPESSLLSDDPFAFLKLIKNIDGLTIQGQVPRINVGFRETTIDETRLRDFEIHGFQVQDSRIVPDQELTTGKNAAFLLGFIEIDDTKVGKITHKHFDILHRFFPDRYARDEKIDAVSLKVKVAGIYWRVMRVPADIRIFSDYLHALTLERAQEQSTSIEALKQGWLAGILSINTPELNAADLKYTTSTDKGLPIVFDLASAASLRHRSFPFLETSQKVRSVWMRVRIGTDSLRIRVPLDAQLFARFVKTLATLPLDKYIDPQAPSNTKTLLEYMQSTLGLDVMPQTLYRAQNSFVDAFKTWEIKPAVNIELHPGALALPGATLNLQPGNVLSVSGRLDDLTVSGKLRLNSLSLTETNEEVTQTFMGTGLKADIKMHIGRSSDIASTSLKPIAQSQGPGQAINTELKIDFGHTEYTHQAETGSKLYWQISDGKLVFHSNIQLKNPLDLTTVIADGLKPGQFAPASLEANFELKAKLARTGVASLYDPDSNAYLMNGHQKAEPASVQGLRIVGDTEKNDPLITVGQTQLNDFSMQGSARWQADGSTQIEITAGGRIGSMHLGVHNLEGKLPIDTDNNPETQESIEAKGSIKALFSNGRFNVTLGQHLARIDIDHESVILEPHFDVKGIHIANREQKIESFAGGILNGLVQMKDSHLSIRPKSNQIGGRTNLNGWLEYRSPHHVQVDSRTTLSHPSINIAVGDLPIRGLFLDFANRHHPTLDYEAAAETPTIQLSLGTRLQHKLDPIPKN